MRGLREPWEYDQEYAAERENQRRYADAAGQAACPVCGYTGRPYEVRQHREETGH